MISGPCCRDAAAGWRGCPAGRRRDWLLPPPLPWPRPCAPNGEGWPPWPKRGIVLPLPPCRCPSPGRHSRPGRAREAAELAAGVRGLVDGEHRESDADPARRPRLSAAWRGSSGDGRCLRCRRHATRPIRWRARRPRGRGGGGRSLEPPDARASARRGAAPAPRRAAPVRRGAAAADGGSGKERRGGGRRGGPDGTNRGSRPGRGGLLLGTPSVTLSSTCL